MGRNLCNWTLGILDSVSTLVTTCPYVQAACQVLKQDGGLEMPLQCYLYNQKGFKQCNGQNLHHYDLEVFRSVGIIVSMCKSVLGMFQVFTQADGLEVTQQWWSLLSNDIQTVEWVGTSTMSNLYVFRIVRALTNMLMLKELSGHKMAQSFYLIITCIVKWYSNEVDGSEPLPLYLEVFRSLRTTWNIR